MGSLYAAFGFMLVAHLAAANPEHHMNKAPIHTVNRRDSQLPLRITNKCGEDLYPAILTQSGTGPGTSGFFLGSGKSKALNVSADWQGRVWGRTNCTFDQGGNPNSGQGGTACSTGDCGRFVECPGAVSRDLSMQRCS
jgi:hypothetical protein